MGAGSKGDGVLVRLRQQAGYHHVVQGAHVCAPRRIGVDIPPLQLMHAARFKGVGVTGPAVPGASSLIVTRRSVLIVNIEVQVLKDGAGDVPVEGHRGAGLHPHAGHDL